MKLGFDVTNVVGDQPTGISQYIKKIIPAIACELNLEEKIRLFYKASRLKQFKNWWRPAGYDTRMFYQSYWPLRTPVDVFHGMDGIVPDWKGAAKVVTIHDLAAIKLNNDIISTKKFRTKKLKNYIKTINATDAIITVSESTKQDVIDIFNVSENKISVCHLGVDERYHPQDNKEKEGMRNKYGLNKEYLLFIGMISGRKNTHRLIHAYAKSKSIKNVDLVLIGGLGYQHEKTISAIEKHRLHDKVKLLGYVPDKDIPLLYSGALGFVFPTIYEGFGLPILEAMACGTPVLAGCLGSAPEISGGYAVHVDPYKTDEISAGIDQLIDQNISKDILINHAGQFTWKKCALNTIKVYEKLINEPLK